jgi:hypothetical protein
MQANNRKDWIPESIFHKWTPINILQNWITESALQNCILRGLTRPGNSHSLMKIESSYTYGPFKILDIIYKLASLDQYPVFF